MKSALSLMFCLFFSTNVVAWTINADFEVSAPGTPASGVDGFSDSFYSLHSSSAPSVKGSQAAVASIRAGREGFGEWGGAFDFPDLVEGDEIWFRVFIYYPVGFDFTAPGGIGLKTLRIHTKSLSGSNEGYFDMLSNGAGGVTVASEITADFFANNAEDNWKSIGVPIVTGSYHAYEQYVKFSSVPGNGIYRVWQDGTLVFEDTVTKTLKTSTSISDFIYVWSYWNGKAPKDQEAYLDHVVITSETPATVDSDGHPFIGLGDITLLAKPKWPVVIVE